MAGAGPRIVVTGGAGFVGRTVCERLVERDAGSRVVVPTPRRAQGRALQKLPGVDVHPCNVHVPRHSTARAGCHRRAFQELA
jgi:nucleoside-diphosphate-sugar epimerase